MSPADAMPRDLDAERRLVGAMLLEPDYAAEAAESLTLEAFSDEGLAAVFGVVRDCVGKPDGAVAHELARRGLGARAREAADAAVSAVNFPYFIRKVREAWAARRLWSECHQITHELSPQSWVDVTETAVQRIHNAVEVRRGAVSTPLAQAAERYMRQREAGTPPFYATGFHNFDREFGGLPRSGLVTVIGPSGHGKSTLALNMLAHVSRDVPVRLFSYEMPAEQVAASVLSAESGECVRQWSSVNMPAVNEGHGRLMQMDFEVVDDLLDSRQIFARCWRYKSQGVGVVAIDYLQNLPLLPGHDSHFSSIVESAQTFQRIAREMGLCVVLVSQGDKEAVKRRREMGLGDAYGGIVIQQVTDLGLSVYRPGYAGDGDVPSDEARLHVVKNKYGAVTSGDGLRLHFNGRTSRFTESV